jgi:hypothetical protein
MGWARAQMAWLRDTGLTEDVITNTWYFQGDADAAIDSGTAQEIADALSLFYLSIDGSLASVLSGTFDIKVYDMADDEPRAPVLTDSYVATPGGSSLPAELAVCMSFRGANTSGVNMRRRRGRLYLGPLTSTAMANPPTNDVQVSTTFISAVDTAYAALAAALPSVGSTGFNHMVYSPTERAAGGSLNDAFEVVTQVHVDNAFDIQRRRGGAATTRTIIYP